MFKAAGGQHRRVKEGGLGVEVALHSEELSPWPAKQSRPSNWSSPLLGGQKVNLEKVNEANHLKYTGAQQTLGCKVGSVNVQGGQALQGGNKRSRDQGHR